jgi:hypothetical protein
MNKQEPRDHHYAPQFYLRNFAVDAVNAAVKVPRSAGVKFPNLAGQSIVAA